MPLRDAMALVIPLALGAPLPVLAQDTLRVDADGPPAWGTSVELVEELDIRGWSDATFERIAGIAIGPQGGVYIADGAVPVVQHLGPDGAWLGSVGAEGADPGEYYSVLGLRWSRRGFLAVLDPANARVTHYESGEYARSFPSSSRHFASDIFAVDTAGRSYVKTRLAPAADPEGPEGTHPSHGWLVFGMEGDLLDTIPVPPEAPVGGTFSVSHGAREFRPFTERTISTITVHGALVRLRNDAYVIYKRDRDGGVTRIERSSSTVEVHPEERRNWEEIVDAFRRGGMSEEALWEGEEGVPTRKPVVRDLFTDDDGRIWVALYADADERPVRPSGGRVALRWRQPALWEVFDPDGRFLGRVTLPEGTRLAAASGTTVWGVRREPDSDPMAVKFRITRD